MIAVRPRRLRRGEVMRALVREHRVDVEQLVAPLFVAERAADTGPIASMPGIARVDVDGAVREARELVALGIRSVLLFGIPGHKDAHRFEQLRSRGRRAADVRGRSKRRCPKCSCVADLCNCEYTDHGHCGILDAGGDVDNDATLELLARTAVTYAEAGVDVVAPSDMMDGRVGAIRVGAGRTQPHGRRDHGV